MILYKSSIIRISISISTREQRSFTCKDRETKHSENTAQMRSEERAREDRRETIFRETRERIRERERESPARVNFVSAWHYQTGKRDWHCEE